jgi:DNA polymerase-3 subunit epsilon
MGAPLHEVPFVVLDLETTGATAADCEITEIGAVRYERGELTGTFHTLVDPGVPIPPTITILTGITHLMVVDAPKIGEALPALLEFIGDAVIVGHNVRFDLSFLNAAAVRLGYGKLPNRTADTHALARRLVRDETRSLRLASLAAHFRSPVIPNHRALEDAKATAHVFWGLLERAGTLGVTHLEDLMRLPTARGKPHYGKIRLTETLPRRPGVYLFVDRDGNVIYVGKAKNLRTRVRSYFYGDDRRSVAQMLRDLDRVDHIECRTELEAEVTELRLIHAHVPRYNRRSRPAKSPHWIKLTDEEFPRLSLVRGYRDDGCLYLGPFRSRRHAGVVQTAIWDAIPLRRCLTKGGKRSAACSFAQLGVAVCPCDGSMSATEYAAIVADYRAGVLWEPSRLLDPLADRLRTHARRQRFEEAADLRDRHRALAAALQARRRWNALRSAGSLWAEDTAGDAVLVEDGRMVAAWAGDGAPPLMRIVESDHESEQVPPTVALAEEAQLLWRWLDRPEVRIVDAASPLAYPIHGVTHLTSLAG